MVENVTDVGHLTSDADSGEDKLQLKANKERKSAWEIAKEYEKEFFETLDALNVQRPTIVARATENIKEMIELISDLEKKGFTYIIPEDGVYFDTAKFPHYGQLSGLDKMKIKAGARVKVVAGKRNPTDFALWKFSPAGKLRDMEWESPWGKGFPGWHIECSAISMKYLTQAFAASKYQPEKFATIDLHTGGEDHIPIHHTNEIAQTEVSTGKQFAHYWFHNRFLMIEGQKMSKSLHNFFTLEDVKERGFHPLALRYLFALAHYRQRLNFTWQSLKAAQTALSRLYGQMDYFSRHLDEENPLGKVTVDDMESKFVKAISDDLGMPQAIAVVSQLLNPKTNLGAKQKYELLKRWDQVLGLGLERVSRLPRVSRAPREVEALAQEREKLRKEKKFAEADKVREEIEKQGWLVEDTAEGPKLKPKMP
jgi:cysteinyl-tRNA synthetase